jgi:hypothetical protein
MVVGKMHEFTMRAGKPIRVKIIRVDQINVYGKVYAKDEVKKLKVYDFEDTFDNMATNITHVSVLKTNPYITLFVVGVPVFLFIKIFKNWEL